MATCTWQDRKAHASKKSSDLASTTEHEPDDILTTWDDPTNSTIKTAALNIKYFFSLKTQTHRHLLNHSAHCIKYFLNNLILKWKKMYKIKT